MTIKAVISETEKPQNKNFIKNITLVVELWVLVDETTTKLYFLAQWLVFYVMNLQKQISKLLYELCTMKGE